MDDSKIIELYFQREEQAIKETEIKYGKLCFNIANNILRSAEDSEECLNDTYMGLWNAIPPARPKNLSAFVCRIARNQSLKRLESLHRQKRSPIMLVSLDELEEILPDESIAEDISDEMLGRAINEFLLSENEEARNVFIRKYWFFESVSDIAKHYSFSEGKVKSILFQVRKRLKKYLIKEGIKI